MNKLIRKSAIILLGIVYAFIIVILSISIYKNWRFLYSFLLAIVVVVIPLVVVLIKKRQNVYIWYKETTDKQYWKFFTAYNSYQSQVLKGGKSYDLFLNEFYNSNLFIPISTDSSGNVRVNELNKENLYISRVLNLLQNRKDLVGKYFQKDKFDYNSYLSLMDDYNKTISFPTDGVSKKNYDIDDEVVREKMKEFVLKCYEPNGIMSLGDRNFGYYIRHRHPELSSAKQYIEAWNEYIGEYEPRDNCKYISDPAYWKNETEIVATLKSLERIEIFYLGLMQENSPIIKSIQRDRSKLEKA